jgi:O-antigen/teichoic acid export membrane protein
MSLYQKVAFNTLAQAAGRMIATLFTLLTTMLLTSYLGKEGFGDYTYVITLLVLFGAVADWGTNTIGVREAARLQKNQSLVFANIFFLKLLLVLPVAILMVVFAWLVPLGSRQPIVLRKVISLSSIFLLLIAFRNAARVVFQTKLRMEKNALVEITTGALMFFATWWLVRAGGGLMAMVGAYLLAVGFGVFLAISLVVKTVRLVFRFDSGLVGRLFKESLPMGAILLMFTMDNRIDTIMLGAFRGSGSVGVYGVASRVYDVLILGAAFLMSTLLPVIATRQKQTAKLKKIYQKAFDVLLLMGVGVAAGLCLLAPLVVRLLTQQRFEEFFDAVGVLRLLALALFLTYFNHLTGYTIVALGKQRPYFLVALASLVFNLLANALLIPRYSYFGAAWVTIFTEGLVLVITTVFIHKLLNFFPSLSSFPKTVWRLGLTAIGK